MGLYAKLLQISATSALPQIPTGTYSVSGIELEVQTVPNRVIFAGTASTPADTRLIGWGQRLPSRNATPTPDGYKILAVGSLTVAEDNQITATIAPGHWCFATTYASAVTGQETPMAVYPVRTVTFAVEEGGASEADEAQKKAA